MFKTFHLKRVNMTDNSDDGGDDDHHHHDNDDKFDHSNNSF